MLVGIEVSGDDPGSTDRPREYLLFPSLYFRLGPVLSVVQPAVVNTGVDMTKGPGV